MIGKLFVSWALMSVCVAVHAIGMTALLRRIQRPYGPKYDRYWSLVWLLIRIAGCVIGLHLVEIAVWASFLAWKGVLPDAESAFYFSAVTYTTVGYGDIVLPSGYRSLAAIEALTGILMCGWSAAFFFAVVSRIYGMKSETTPAGPDRRGTTI